MPELSPVAQAVMDAMTGVMCQPPISLDEPPCSTLAIRLMAAAALRAAADQLSYAHGSWAGPSAIINEDDLLTIAAELDPTTTETTDD